MDLDELVSNAVGVRDSTYRLNFEDNFNKFFGNNMFQEMGWYFEGSYPDIVAKISYKDTLFDIRQHIDEGGEYYSVSKGFGHALVSCINDLLLILHDWSK